MTVSDCISSITVHTCLHCLVMRSLSRFRLIIQYICSLTVYTLNMLHGTNNPLLLLPLFQVILRLTPWPSLGRHKRHRDVGNGYRLWFAATRRRKDGLEQPRHDKTQDHNDKNDVCDSKTENMQRVTAQLVECRVGEGDDDREDGGRDVSDDRSPVDGNPPVLARDDY